MAKKKNNPTNSDTETTDNSSSDDDLKTPEKLATDYEKQRQLRIAHNLQRMQLLGLPKIASSLMGSSQITKTNSRNVKSESKKVVKEEEDDDDYEPNDEDEEDEDDGGSGLSSSSEELEDESVCGRSFKSRSRKVKKSKSRKQISMKQPMEIPDFMDEDEALKQAIALSLKDSGENSSLQHCSFPQGSNSKVVSSNKKGHAPQEENTRRKKRKPLASRVQMTEDDLVIHFCQIDEAGKGSVTLRDLERMAAAHDFTWTDKELADMIRCFDSDRDGKLTQDDFRNIVARCNMIQGLQNH